MDRYENLRYWYNNTSMLGFARLIRERLPVYIKPFVKICVDETFLDANREKIIVYFGFNHYPKRGKAFSYEFSLEDLEEASNGKGYIAKKK